MLVRPEDTPIAGRHCFKEADAMLKASVEDRHTSFRIRNEFSIDPYVHSVRLSANLGSSRIKLDGGHQRCPVGRDGQEEMNGSSLRATEGD